MKKAILLFLLLVISAASFAQNGDFIIIKKRDQPYKTIFAGSFVRFLSKSGEWFDGKIVNIQNDSISFREVIIQQVPTPWGVPRLDTMTTFIRKIHYSDIIAIPRRKASFEYIKNGALFMIGGGGYMALNVINSATLHYSIFGKENRGQLLTAAGVFGLGELLHHLRKPYLIIGKTYTIKYVKG